MEWETLGWIAVFALPIAVGLTAIFWPEPVPRDRSVTAIRERIEREDRPRRRR